MPKTYKVRALVTSVYQAYVLVPDDMNAEDIMEWYYYNGSGGEFEETDTDVVWDFAYYEPQLVEDADHYDISFVEEIVK